AQIISFVGQHSEQSHPICGIGAFASRFIVALAPQARAGSCAGLLAAAQDLDAVFGGAGIGVGRVALRALAVFADGQSRLFHAFVDGAQVVVGVAQLRIHAGRLLVLGESALRVVVGLVGGAHVHACCCIVAELERRFVIGDCADQIVIALLVFGRL